MSFLGAGIVARLRDWREPILWGALLALGLWLIFIGYMNLAPLSFVVGLVAAAAGFGLLRDALRRRRLRSDVPSEGMVVIDEARIGYLGPRGGGFVDLPAVVSVEIVTRPHVPPDSSHAWLIRAEDGSELVIPLGAHGAEALVSTLSALPGIDFDLGAATITEPGARRATLWRKAG
ncbi:hypothetical protein [Amaricoccus solimangrovi]|uniref:Uncharacterized protein n=1 Tax=Amaricoccus solimangrovi TaxID=2589815 RepID=A0A501WQW8_9RHOB|nr:hypothetical protein [Amaricoccus solimangrovi]TPE50464.1 hypothetical protein FJM51_11760 [Amaricoccus solimangrovi]